MIGVKYPSVRELRWTNDSLCCLLELHDNSILLTEREMEERVRWDGREEARGGEERERVRDEEKKK